jgi:hypothetical protein
MMTQFKTFTSKPGDEAKSTHASGHDVALREGELTRAAPVADEPGT